MVATLFSLAIVATLHLPSLVLAACTNITNIRIDSDTASSQTTEFGRVLETLVCPATNKTGCFFPRNSYTITIPRYLNISTSKTVNPNPQNPNHLPLFDLTPAQENEIFDLVGTNWALQQGEGGINFTTPDAGVLDTRFIPRDRFIDNTIPEANGGPPDTDFKVKVNSNASLEFLPQTRRLTGILRNCGGDMSAFEGVGIRAVAAYSSNRSRLLPGASGQNVTEVGGGLSTFSVNLTGNSGSGSGSTKKGAGSRMGSGTSGHVVLATSFVLASVFIML